VTVYIAFLRAINVGGTGMLPMAELRALCETAGFRDVTTYIQSGNVLFRSKLARHRVREKLESALADKLGKPVGVLLRTPEELRSIVERNPFPRAAPNRLIVFFLEAPLERGTVGALSAPGKEELAEHGAEVYVHYPDGQGQSKLKLPFAKTGTGRNLNTIRKMLDLAGALP
jgi:uncharacterized protein (DUF1697 family)